MILAVFIMTALAAMLAWALAAKLPEHRPIAWLLSVGLAADVAGWVLDAAVLAPLRDELGASRPWTGWARVAGHAADA